MDSINSISSYSIGKPLNMHVKSDGDIYALSHSL